MPGRKVMPLVSSWSRAVHSFMWLTPNSSRHVWRQHREPLSLTILREGCGCPSALGRKIWGPWKGKMGSFNQCLLVWYYLVLNYLGMIIFMHFISQEALLLAISQSSASFHALAATFMDINEAPWAREDEIVLKQWHFRYSDVTRTSKHMPSILQTTAVNNLLYFRTSQNSLAKE